MRAMKIGFISCARRQSGIADYCRDLREALHTHEGISTFLVSGRCYCSPLINHGNYPCVTFHDSWFERYILGGVQLISSRTAGRFKPRLLCRGWNYKRSMSSNSPDIVHYQMDREIFGIQPLWILSRERKFGLVATLHEFEFEIDEKLYSKVFKVLDKIIVHSDYSRKKVLNYLDDRGKILLIPHGTWVDKELEEKRDQISIFGIHSQFKHYGCVIDAVEMVKRRFKRNISVHFYGYIEDGVKRKYNQILKERELEDYIIFHGSLSEDEFHKCVRHSQFIITPYEDSHASGIILKAMGHGTPVLSSRVGSIPEYLGEMGEYFSLEKPVSLAEKIIMLMEDPDKRRTMGRGLWEKAKNEYAWDIVAEKTIQVYREILGKTD
jgi:glycosyltransferase involved in cell wall biosynthesis